jgi:hypothetical protein
MSDRDPPARPEEPGTPFPRGPEQPSVPPSTGFPPPPAGPPPPPLPGAGDGTGDVLPALRRGERPLALRPLRVGEMLDAAITLYRRNYRSLMAIVAFVVVPYSFIEQSILWSVVRPFEDQLFVNPEDASGDVAITLVFSALSFLVIQPFVTAAIARATAEVYLGISPKIGDTYRFALSRTHTILWVTLLSALVTVFGVLLLIVGAFLFFVRFYFSTTVVVVEGKRGTGAMRRSWRLAKGSFWKIFGTIFLAGILSSIVAGILTIPTALLADRMGESGWFLSALGTSLAQIIVTPFSSIIAVLLYFDMRIRKEGFDLALMAQEVERPAGG